MSILSNVRVFNRFAASLDVLSLTLNLIDGSGYKFQLTAIHTRVVDQVAEFFEGAQDAIEHSGTGREIQILRQDDAANVTTVNVTVFDSPGSDHCRGWMQLKDAPYIIEQLTTWLVDFNVKVIDQVGEYTGAKPYLKVDNRRAAIYYQGINLKHSPESNLLWVPGADGKIINPFHDRDKMPEFLEKLSIGPGKTYTELQLVHKTVIVRHEPITWLYLRMLYDDRIVDEMQIYTFPGIVDYFKNVVFNTDWARKIKITYKDMAPDEDEGDDPDPDGQRANTFTDFLKLVNGNLDLLMALQITPVMREAYDQYMAMPAPARMKVKITDWDGWIVETQAKLDAHEENKRLYGE